jgi:hypothetical protein
VVDLVRALTDAAHAELTAVTAPGGPRCTPTGPDHHVVQPAVLVTGRRPS